MTNLGVMGVSQIRSRVNEIDAIRYIIMISTCQQATSLGVPVTRVSMKM